MNVVFFVEDINEIFAKERGYTEAGFTHEARLRERQSLTVKEIVIRIRSWLESVLARS